MFFKPAVLVTSALLTLAAATPLVARTDPIPASQCNTGPVQCCQTVQKAGDSPAKTLIGLLGIVVENLDVVVGLTCSPLSVIGIGGTSW